MGHGRKLDSSRLFTAGHHNNLADFVDGLSFGHLTHFFKLNLIFQSGVFIILHIINSSF